MTEESLLERAIHLAFAQLDQADGHIELLAEPFKTVAIVVGAQGIIDNGGLAYFFENDWPHHPPYPLFVEAYKRIGRTQAAKALNDAANSFGIPNPQRDATRRRAFLRAHYDPDRNHVSGWDDCLCGDEQVWSDLAAWIRQQPEFAGACE